MLEEGINDLLRAHFENLTFHTTVQRLSEGSVIVEFDITVTNNDNDNDDFIGKMDIAKALLSNINDNYGFLFGKFSTANNSVIIAARSEERSQHPENTDGQSIEKNMQSDATMRTTEKYLTNKHSTQSIAQILAESTTATTTTTTTVSQIPEDWENIKDMEISSESEIDSIREDEKQMVDTESEVVSTGTEELPETATDSENIEMATDISPSFKSIELEPDFGSGEEDSTERVLSLELN